MKIKYAVIAVILGITPLSAEPKSIASLPLAKTAQPQIRPAALFSAQSINGKTISLESYKGKVVFINYWATWCPPCVAEVPELIQLQKKYAGKLQVIGLSMDDNVSDVQKFAARAQFNYPIIMATDELKTKYARISAIPTTVIISKNLMIVQIEAGYHKPEFFDEIVQRLSK